MHLILYSKGIAKTPHGAVFWLQTMKEEKLSSIVTSHIMVVFSCSSSIINYTRPLICLASARVSAKDMVPYHSLSSHLTASKRRSIWTARVSANIGRLLITRIFVATVAADAGVGVRAAIRLTSEVRRVRRSDFFAHIGNGRLLCLICRMRALWYYVSRRERRRGG